MAKVTIKNRDVFKKIAKDQERKAKKVERDFSKKAPKKILEWIFWFIHQEQSPVAGNNPMDGTGKYRQYSEEYAKRENKGQRRPVTMEQSGKMLRSFKTRSTKDGFSIWNTSEIFKYHNRMGAGRSEVLRRMLPTDGKMFNIKIRAQIKVLLNKIINKVYK